MRLILPILLLLAACGGAPAPDEVATVAAPQPVVQPIFPVPDRAVAQISTGSWSDEDSRDDTGESERVFALLGIRPGLTVADIGAGSGYYTVRLSPALGSSGKLIANDIIPDYVTRLKARVAGLGFTNVEFLLGDPGNANLPANSTDIALMVHMYHEIGEPYAFLWRLRPALREGGQVIVVDGDRPIAQHGTPFRLLVCEFEAVGYKLVSYNDKAHAGGYLARFVPEGERPAPDAITVCKNP